jgi:DNA-binding PadR family transcriptional regulator
VSDDQPPVQMKPKRASPKPGTMKKRSMQLADNRRARITLLTALKASGPALSRDLAVTIGFKAGEDIQPVYQRLYELKRDGLAEKGDDNRYSVTDAGLAALADVVQEEAGTAAEASEKAA